MITTEGGYVVDVEYAGDGLFSAVLYYSDGWPDGSGKIVLSQDDIERITGLLTEATKNNETL